MAAASVRLAAPSLPRMFDTCTLAVFGAMNSTEAISRLLRPAAMSRSTSRSRLVSDGEHRAVRQVGRGADPSPAGQVVQGPAQRPGREPVRDLGRLDATARSASSRRPASASASASRHRVRAIS